MGGTKSWANLSEESKQLVEGLLNVDEQARLSATKAMLHPWMSRAGPIMLLPSGKQANIVDHAVQVLASMLRFVQLDRLQQLTLAVCARVISETELFRSELLLPWYELFFALDKDEDGELCQREFVEGFQSLLQGTIMVPAEQYVALWRCVDLDESQMVEWGEWICTALVSAKGVEDAEEPLNTAFRL